ncbi:translation initiation factor IF-2 N-terminal domain-containing protein, partial [Corynebacterium vitaeruminis]|uniref:translation initiation factor IF-2 N-terminal domain-containing protein n=1 Tax=Corynebacterium vitaeruminis TaxID=38305 RepID=UPI0006602247
MSGKLRVHELAKQLGVTSKELLAELKAQGEFVKTASSTVEPPVVRKMKKVYEEKNAGAGADASAQAPATKAAPKPAAKPGAKPAAKPGAKPAAPAAAKPGAKPAAKP